MNLKKRLLSAAVAAVMLISIAVPALAAGIGNFRYSHSIQIADNLLYTNRVAWRDDVGRGESYTLTFFPGGEAYAAVTFGESVYGRTGFDDVIAYAESRGQNVLAAVNADFFSMQTGVPLGVVIEDYIYKSSPEQSYAVVFRADGSVSFARQPRVAMTFETAYVEQITATHLNKMRHPFGGIYVFTEDFGEETRTSGDGWFVRLRILDGEMRIGGELTLEVEELFEYDGSIAIDSGYIVLSGPGGATDAYYSFNAGDIVTMRIETDDETLMEARYACGGGDIIVENGEMADPESWDSALDPRNPRTAIGLTADGTVVIAAIDGRDSRMANGVTMADLAYEMLARGCVEVMNLDGGGSTVMGVRMPGEEIAEVVNRPTDGHPRRVSTYILFVTDAVPDGRARYLALENGGIPVLAGSSIELIPAAADSGRMPAPVPGDIVYSAREGDMDGSVYTARGDQWPDRVTMYSPSLGIEGWGEVFVITRPTSVFFADESGAAITSLTLDGGDKIQLTPAATYHRLPVVSQPHSFTYEVEGSIGEVTEDGMLIASDGGAGRVVVRAGEQSAALDIVVGRFEDMRGHWAARYVNSLYGMGIVNGMTETEYMPEQEMLRRDFLLMLYRAVLAAEPPDEEQEFMDIVPLPEDISDILRDDTDVIPDDIFDIPPEDEPDIPDEPPPDEPEDELDAEPPFTDVPLEAYYYDAAVWAKENGIAYGDDEGRLDPDSYITREDAFTFVYRALDLLTIPYTDGGADLLDPYEDADDVTGYAAAPTATLIKLGVVEGADGRLNPQGVIKRGEMAKVLRTVLDNARFFQRPY